MDDFEISPRYDEHGEDIDGAEGEPHMSVLSWKRDFGPNTFMFIAISRYDSTHVNVSQVVTSYEPIHSMGFQRGEAGPRPD